MQQHPHDSAATFYAKLVNVPPAIDHEGQRQAEGQASEAGAQQTDLWQQQQQQQASAAVSVPFKPVKFAQPVVLDPNTGVVTLQPISSQPQHHPQHDQPLALHHSAASSAGSSSQAAPQLDLSSQASRYRTTSARSATSAAAAAAAHPAAPSAFGSSSKRPIDRSNVGYQLLQKAGWREGSGLGRQQQGMAAPLQLQPQKGSKGLGFAPQDPLQMQRQQIAAAAAAAAASGSAAAKAPAAPAAGPVLGGKLVAALVAAELASEDLDTKVKRHRQLLEQEAKEQRDKAIQLYMQRAFNEPSLADVGDHARVLGRNSRLTKTNPLLDDDEDY
uniref:G-patch domain-containing protein n=1 Tax=Tetradesmus obliquus TaxID=3088 RepID=A0A383WLP1_TETOB|eukprot:jgi/Sobl393_1/6307/SZX78380.1